MKKIRTHIYKRQYASGKFVWMVRWWDASTRKWRALKGGNNRDEAEEIDRILRDDLRRGVDPTACLRESSDETISELIELFYKSVHFLSCGTGWQATIRCQLDGLIKDTLGPLRFSELTREKLYAFYLDLKNKQNLCHSTIKKYHLKLCFLGDVYVERHPDKLNLPRQLKDFNKRFPNQAPRREINFLTPEEIEKILDKLKKSISDVAYPFIKILAHTGMRREEARNLKWNDIDFESGFIHIRKSKNGKSRSIPMESAALEALSDIPRRSEFVFVHEDGSRPNKDSLRPPFQRAAKRAGIVKRVDLHTLRHSYGSNKIRSGWGLKKVSLLLGHSDISLTARIYTHLLDGDLKVQDDFRFDNPLRKQNSGGSRGVESVPNTPAVLELPTGTPTGKMDVTTIMAMIQMLQQQLSAQTENVQAAPCVASKKSENNRMTPNVAPIPVEKQAICNAGVTDPQKRAKKKAVLERTAIDKNTYFQHLKSGVPGASRTRDLQLRRLESSAAEIFASPSNISQISDERAEYGRVRASRLYARIRWVTRACVTACSAYVPQLSSSYSGDNNDGRERE